MGECWETLVGNPIPSSPVHTHVGPVPGEILPGYSQSEVDFSVFRFVQGPWYAIQWSSQVLRAWWVVE